jgi:nucleotide-binding universal stress UspA family protein
MFERILVPLDGSAFAEAALTPACELAARFGSKLLLTTAVEPLGLPLVHSGEALDAEERAEGMGEASAYLEGLVEKLRKAGFPADLTLYLAEAGAAIAGAAEISHADLIVMATRMGWTLPAEGPRHRSVTLDLLARSRVPILSCHLVPTAAPASTITEGAERPTGPQLAGPDLPIVVPLDGSIFAEQALPTAQALAEAFGAYLILVRAVPDETKGSEQSAHGQREARDYLARLREQLEVAGVSATAVAEPGVAINVIEHTWREHGSGMLVMASHGQGGHHAQQPDTQAAALPRSLIGSVAAEILEELEVPTLVVQPEVLRSINFQQ